MGANLKIDLDERLWRGAAQGDGAAEQLWEEGRFRRCLRPLRAAVCTTQ